ncbi:MAG: ribonuclease HII [Hydrogenibacillus schlegelii]|uniref:Ribonuclease HII n=1 Tax=Hydrogenibacillus schlegelii TaxID=1484 RepID=A0A2T5GFG0_HYDSH|nr:ribonuclease HII [Hydrogenibacillus schlegelii]MBT9281475.1 ribonuclease HII [Hydrogenibacillus schlegelii]PTQ54923.1 MAG: Ribonuclease HII [Hydrogenibacillus schlegelii]
MPAGEAFERRFWAAGIRRLAGVDEVGRGPLAGPVVAAAVILSPERPIPGLDDSKRLSPKRREALYGRILEAALAVAVGRATAAEIDRLGIVPATRLAMRRALWGLAPAPEAVLVDALPVEAGVPETVLLHGDRRSISIAAASIVAKVVRDRWMEAWGRVYPAFGFERHRGYGTKEHRERLERFGPTPLHRRTFLSFLASAPAGETGSRGRERA